MSAIDKVNKVSPTPVYQPRRAARSVFVWVRGLRHHCHVWGEASMAAPDRPTLVLAHGWMDVGASFQFLVDQLPADRHIVALDWRGFGRSHTPPGTDTYYFADYLGDLDALLRASELGLADEPPIDLCGHSMGGNVVMLYAGVRPQRIRRLINLEGFGLPARKPEDAPRHHARWLDELRQPMRLRDYATIEDVARRLIENNPRLDAERAAWLAPHWSEPDGQGRWRIQGDPAHRRVHAVMYRVDEILAHWRAITAPVLWVEGRQTDITQWWGDRFPREEFEQRLGMVSRLRRVVLEDCAHMLHLDQPEALASAVEQFLTDPM